MPTDVATLVARTRRYLRQYDLEVQTVATMSSSTTSASVASTTNFQTNDPIEVNSEVMLVTAVTSATTLAVARGVFGTTAVAHANNSLLTRRPAFYTMEIIEGLNRGIQACFPRIYKQVVDETTLLTSNTWEFTIPTMSSPAIPIPFISKIQVMAQGGAIPFRDIRSWDLVRGSTPKVRFRRASFSGDTMRIIGYGPFPALSSTADTLDALWPARCEHLPCLFAAASLLHAAEGARVRSDRGMGDDREQANRVGASAAQGSQLMNQFYVELERQAMPPMPKPVKSVL